MTFFRFADIIIRLLENSPCVAQLDRVFGYEPKGRGFESLLARQRQAAAPKSRSSLLWWSRFLLPAFFIDIYFITLELFPVQGHVGVAGVIKAGEIIPHPLVKIAPSGHPDMVCCVDPRPKGSQQPGRFLGEPFRLFHTGAALPSGAPPRVCSPKSWTQPSGNRALGREHQGEMYGNYHSYRTKGFAFPPPSAGRGTKPCHH